MLEPIRREGLVAVAFSIGKDWSRFLACFELVAPLGRKSLIVYARVKTIIHQGCFLV